MPRKTNPAVVKQTTVNIEALTQGKEALEHTSSNAMQVASMMHYELAYNKDRIVQETRFYMGQSAEAMLEAGKRLVLLKENEGHGEFVQIVEERLGIPARTAQVMMQAAVKYMTNPALESKAQTFALLGKSKMFELMTLDDDELIELTEGGSVADMKLDDIDRMSVRELKAKLREAKETQEATDKVLAGKNKKLDQLQSELERKKASTSPEEWEWGPNRRALIDAGEGIAGLVQTELRRALIDVNDQAATAGGESMPEEIEMLQAQVLAGAMQSLIALQKEFRINVDLETMVTPPWMQGDASDGKQQ